MAIACGEANCPSPLPRVANVLMNLPSLENTIIRELFGVFSPWPSAMKMSPLLATATPVGASNVSKSARPGPWLAEFQQDLARRAELGHLHSLVALCSCVGDPHISVLIDRSLVRFNEQPGAEILQRLAVGTELDNRLTGVVSQRSAAQKLFCASTAIALIGAQPRGVVAQLRHQTNGLGRSFAQE